MGDSKENVEKGNQELKSAHEKQENKSNTCLIVTLIILILIVVGSIFGWIEATLNSYSL